ncbi:hypothetical protein B0T24DRAFT_683526 [Lasiosphaeria ovina]|uniref:Protein kinase domain-containing protein n=1 Tax=Lasiosphaeria ovina TaxID=92902 RepID=A0AAE0JV29_9PEZI|nr:hypothetical protein B0T24DRAFT_683526 [Lasiosphaeria ovina]
MLASILSFGVAALAWVGSQWDGGAADGGDRVSPLVPTSGPSSASSHAPSSSTCQTRRPGCRIIVSAATKSNPATDAQPSLTWPVLSRELLAIDLATRSRAETKSTRAVPHRGLEGALRAHRTGGEGPAATATAAASGGGGKGPSGGGYSTLQEQQLLNMVGRAGAALADDQTSRKKEESEWCYPCDPWPTNDGWRSPLEERVDAERIYPFSHPGIANLGYSGADHNSINSAGLGDAKKRHKLKCKRCEHKICDQDGGDGVTQLSVACAQAHKQDDLRYDQKVDIWAMGELVFRMMTVKPSFADTTRRQ